MTARGRDTSVAANPVCVVRRMQAHYVVPASNAGARARINRALDAAVNDILEAALERAGVPLDEQICVRSVNVAARLRLDMPDSALALAWAVALGDGIACEVREGGPNVVRYRSRSQALVDLVLSASRGDARRAWAWRQLGLWSGADDASREVLASRALATLACEAHAAPAVIAEVAERGGPESLIALARFGTPVEWASLERAVLGAAGAETTRESSTDEASPSGIAHIVARIRRVSRIAIANRECGMLPATAAHALATLALFEAAPDIALAASSPIGAIRSALAPSASPSERPISPATHGPDAGELAPRVREGAATHAGGLLFLLHVVRDTDLPAMIAAEPLLETRGLRWTLHRLALSIGRLEPTDPAALAFCGLSPSRMPPSHDEPAPSIRELKLIDSYHRLVVDALRARLGNVDHGGAEQGNDAAAVLSSVIRRRAEIVADPAWIEARFSLDDVSVAIRRSGLDLNLDWLPWLGAVVRFAYV
jgi:hypothetical protein